MGATDLEMVRGFGAVNLPVVKQLEDVLEEWGGEAFGHLLFFTVHNEPKPSPGRRASSASATLRPPQPFDQGTVPIGNSLSPFELPPVSFCSRPDSGDVETYFNGLLECSCSQATSGLSGDMTFSSRL